MVGRSQRNTQDYSQRTNTQGSQKSRANDLTEEQFEVAVHNVTAFLLRYMNSKCKVRKEDITVNALNKTSRQYSAIMARVKYNLESIFGLELVKLPDSEDFIVMNKHRSQFSKLAREMSTEEDIQDNMILTVVLASIFMNRGQMYESHIMTILESIGFLSDKFYGPLCTRNMKDHVTTLVKKVFVKQMYLNAKEVPRPEVSQNPPLPEGEHKVKIYSWDFRALLEVDVDKIVDYLAKIHDGNRPVGFPTAYYKELKVKQEQIRTNAVIETE